MRSVTADTQTWLAARGFLLDRSDDFCLQLTRVRESFDPEAIHDLRVSSRRLREGLALFVGCFRKGRLARILGELKALTEMLGSIRNNDEAILFFYPLADKCDMFVNAQIMKIVARLQQERSEEKLKLERQLKKTDPASIAGRIRRLCSSPRIFSPDTDTLFQPVAATILDALLAREKTLLELLPAALLEENVTAQHRLRIAVKRYRYRMEFLAHLAGGGYKHLYSVIKEYQEILGHMHDLDVFSGLVTAPASAQGEISRLQKIIGDRRHALFRRFMRLQGAKPLDETCRLVRSLL